MKYILLLSLVFNSHLFANNSKDCKEHSDIMEVKKDEMKRTSYYLLSSAEFRLEENMVKITNVIPSENNPLTLLGLDENYKIIKTENQNIEGNSHNQKIISGMSLIGSILEGNQKCLFIKDNNGADIILKYHIMN